MDGPLGEDTIAGGDLDPAAAAYEEKCEALADSLPEDWQGVWVMTTK